MKDYRIIDLTPDNISEYGVCGYKDVKKHVELQKKIDWFSKYYSKGIRIKAIITQTGSYQGMLEYIPGKYANRPVNAENYMFIHCLFVGFKSEYKGKGFASALLDECVDESKKSNFDGVAVVTRKGSFMANSNIFLKKGFEIVDSAKPDFELLVLKFKDSSTNPKFRISEDSLKLYKDGLTIMRSAQCP